MKRVLTIALTLAAVLLYGCAPQQPAQPLPPSQAAAKQEPPPERSPAYFVISDTAAGEQSRRILPENSLYDEITARLADAPHDTADGGDFILTGYGEDGEPLVEANARPEHGEWYRDVYLLYETASVDTLVITRDAVSKTYDVEQHGAAIYRVQRALNATLEQLPEPEPLAQGFTVALNTRAGCCLLPYTVTQTHTFISDQGYPDAGLHEEISALYNG